MISTGAEVRAITCELMEVPYFDLAQRRIKLR